MAWGKLANSTKWHYFKDDGRSLCGKWLSLGDPPDDGAGDMKSKYNCAGCWKKRQEQISAPANTKASDGKEG